MVKTEGIGIAGKIAYGVAIAGVAVGLGFGAALGNANTDKKDLTTALANNHATVLELQSQLADNQITLENFQAQVSALGIQVVSLTDMTEADKAVIADYETELAVMQEEAITQIETFNGFKEDELSLDNSTVFSLDNGDYEKLIESEIEFYGVDIDYREILTLSGAFASNDNDFDGETMYKLSDGDLKYEVKFDANMSALPYNNDDVTFDFLGTSITVVNWTSDSVFFAPEYVSYLAIGEEANGVTVLSIGETKVLLQVGDEIKSLEEDDTHSFDDVDVRVEEIFYSDIGDYTSVKLAISEDLTNEIKDGDPFTDNYDWSIDENSIGIVLVEDFDEDDTAITEGDVFSLPGGYLSLGFELTTPTMNELSFKYDSDFNGMGNCTV